MAEALQRLVDDSAERVRMGTAGRERIATSFSVPMMVRQLTELYAGSSPTDD
jgi:glycosyltransferase involved in cell wall biosynthesis